MPREASLLTKKCVPCEGGVCPLRLEEVEPLMAQLGPEWRLIRESGKPKCLVRDYGDFTDFVGPMRFAQDVTDIAEAEGHHPDLKIRWGYVGVSYYTHAIGGLSENDFISAAKTEARYENRKSSYGIK